jgi:hypothetical protein
VSQGGLMAGRSGSGEDALKHRSLHAERGLQVGTAGAHVLLDVQYGAVGCGQAEGVEAEPVRRDLLPHSDLPRRAQRVAL